MNKPQPTALPPILQGLMSATPTMPAAPGLSGAMMGGQQGMGGQMPSYQMGGMVGPGGQPMRPQMSTSPAAMQAGLQPGGVQAPPDFRSIEMQVQAFVQQNPQAVQQIQAEVQRELMSGELTPDALNFFVQVATTAMQNPDMWPQLRQALISQGHMDAEDVSEEYDPGLMIALYIMGKTMGGMPDAAQGQAPAQVMPSMEEGGPLPERSSNPDGSIPINAHEGEYVIPADVVRAMGTKHFDSLIEKARS